jgi:Methyltransferase domain
MNGINAYNTNNQTKASWIERATLACDLLSAGIAAGKTESISDIGCGDQKVRRLIRDRGWFVRYTGFDLVPQTEDVQFLDLNVAQPPGKSDAAIVLGVLEYVDDVGACLRRLAGHAPLLVVSHAVRDGDAFDQQAQQDRGWKNHLYAEEFAALLMENGWRIVDARATSDSRTRIWLAQSMKPI